MSVDIIEFAAVGIILPWMIIAVLAFIASSWIRSAYLLQVLGYGFAAVVFLCWALMILLLHATGLTPFPIWIALGMMLVAVASISVFTYLSTKNITALTGFCLSCGYDLRGNPDAKRCPECGEPINS